MISKIQKVSFIDSTLYKISQIFDKKIDFIDVELFLNCKLTLVKKNCKRKLSAPNPNPKNKKSRT